jgi:multidrug resistance protein MdtO
MMASETVQLVRDELTLSPARTARMLRMTAIVALIVIVSMALRVPEAAVSAYMVFFFAKADVATTVKTGIAAVVGLTVALALAFVAFLFSLDEPALRLPLMAGLTFGGMYFMRASPIGALGLIVGFIATYSLTIADQYRSPEALSRGLLWQWVVVAYPVGLLVVSDLAFGQRPDEVYRDGVAARLDAVAGALENEAGAAARLARFVRMGVRELAPYAKGSVVRSALLRQVELLGFLAQKVERKPETEPILREVAQVCVAARRALQGERGAPLDTFELRPQDPILLSLVTTVQTVALGVHTLVSSHGEERARESRPARAARKQSEWVRFALKVTLAAMTAYLIYSGLEWYSIHTAMITCFFVAQENVGATIHKLTLRLSGAIIGAALGIGAILFVLPGIQSVGGLAILIAVVTLLATWFSTGSQRISYAGFQLALAFYLTVLQGYSETTKLYVGRDRVIGILLGNILMSVVFTSLWPVRAEPALRQALSRAVGSLAGLLRSGKRDELEAAFYADFTEARQYAPLVRFEQRDREIQSLLTPIAGLFIPIHAIVREPDVAELRESFAPWLEALAKSIAAARPIPAFQLPDAASATAEKSPGLRLLRLQIEAIAA